MANKQKVTFGFVMTNGETEEHSIIVADGESSYDTWAKNQPEGADTSEEAFLETLGGVPGVGIATVTVTTEIVEE